MCPDLTPRVACVQGEENSAAGISWLRQAANEHNHEGAVKLLKEMGVGLVDPNAPEGSIMAEAKERAERREVEKEQRREEREEERARREEERALAASRQPEPEPQEAEEEEEEQAAEEGEAESRQVVSEGIPSRTAAAPAPARQRRANIGAKRTPSPAQRAAFEHAEKLDIGRLAAELERQGFPLPPGVSHAAMKAALVGHLSKRSLTATPQDMFDEFDADGSGSLERSEIALVCASLGDLRGEEGLDDLFDAVDLDGSKPPRYCRDHLGCILPKIIWVALFRECQQCCCGQAVASRWRNSRPGGRRRWRPTWARTGTANPARTARLRA